jgi:hypothetical protein
MLFGECGRVGCTCDCGSTREVSWARHFLVPDDASKPTPKEIKNRAARQAAMMRSREDSSGIQHQIQGSRRPLGED